MTTEYICDKCGKHWKSKEEARLCELSHTEVTGVEVPPGGYGNGVTTKVPKHGIPNVVYVQFNLEGEQKQALYVLEDSAYILPDEWTARAKAERNLFFSKGDEIDTVKGSDK